MSAPPGPPGSSGPPEPDGPSYPDTPPAGQPQYPYPPAGGPPPGYGVAPQGYAPGPLVPPPNDPLVPQDLGGWFQRVFDVVRRSFKPLLILTVVYAAVIYLLALIGGGAIGLTLFAGGGGSGSVTFSVLIGIVLFVVMIAVYAITQGAAFYTVIKDAAGEQVSLGTAVAFARPRALALIGWSIVASLLVGVGFLLLVIPGIYMLIVVVAGLYGVVLVERQGLGRVFSLVNNRFWPTAARLLLYFVIATVYYAIVSLITNGIAAALGGSDSVLGASLASLVQIVLLLPLTIAAYAVPVVTYAELRFHDKQRPGALTPTLSAEVNA